MDSVQETLGDIDVVLMDLFSNPYVAAVMAIFVIMYGALAAPQLPAQFAKLFDYTLFKILFLAMILFVNHYNSTIAIIMAVAFFLSLQTLSRHKVGDFAKYVTQIKTAVAGQDGAVAEGDAAVTAPTADDKLGQQDVSDQAMDVQVSGLAGRTPHYLGAQGMGDPAGYAGQTEGADVNF